MRQRAVPNALGAGCIAAAYLLLPLPDRDVWRDDGAAALAGCYWCEPAWRTGGNGSAVALQGALRIALAIACAYLTGLGRSVRGPATLRPRWCVCAAAPLLLQLLCATRLGAAVRWAAASCLALPASRDIALRPVD